MTTPQTTAPPDAARHWAQVGTQLLLEELDTLTDDDLAHSSALPGWTRRHLLAHVASNAEAIARLLTWAETGVVTPMYASPQQRTDDITAGATRPDMRDWVRQSAANLDLSMRTLTEPAWDAKIVTAQGRTVTAAETPWMRARETCIHAVDLATGITFDQLPTDFLTTLINDIARKRSASPDRPAIRLTVEEQTIEIAGSPPVIVAQLSTPTAAQWLSGRANPDRLPSLPPWL